MLDGPAPVEAQYAEEGPGSGIFREEPEDPLQSREAQQQPSRPDWAIGERLGAGSEGTLFLYPQIPSPQIFLVSLK